ncbi:PAS domain-containing protein [Paraflavisolibacter sp. H34]|uniref:PAS domain-containing protein n=1 Tax=Huijunlia imazamoxiresistens TaxID=3127457 RepID=UPI003015AE7C
MLSTSKNSLNVNNFAYLPSFAAHLLSERLEEFSRAQLQCLVDLDAPVLKLFTHLSPEELEAKSLQINTRFLKYLSENKAGELIHIVREEYKSAGQLLLMVSQEDIKAEDVTLFSLSRKKTLLDFLPGFTADVRQAVETAKEIDLYLASLETESFNASLRLLKSRVQKEESATRKIADNSPVIIFIYSLQDDQVHYLNNKGKEFFGPLPAKPAAGPPLPLAFLHPDDREQARASLNDMATARDGETRTLENRLKNKEGRYRWTRSYFTVFNRDEEGHALDIIAFLLDIQEEKAARQQLEESQRQLLEAQEIAQTGSYRWHFNNSQSYLSPQSQKILEASENEHDSFWERVHPADRARLEEAVARAKAQSGQLDEEYRYLAASGEKVISCRGVIYYENGQPAGMSGTVMDVTERHRILRQLTETNKLYEQAQAISHLGHYIYDVEKNEIACTAEVARIFNMEPQAKYDMDLFRRYRHPDDNELIHRTMAHALETGETVDMHFRIQLPDGTNKTLHSRGEAERNDQGKVVRYIGTLQDVTERQALLQQLEQSEILYKQAQALAHIGSWRYEIRENKTYGSEEAFQIFGLPPTAGEAPTETFLPLIHPEDRPRVLKAVKKAIHRQAPLNLYHRIRLPQGLQKTVLLKGNGVTNSQGTLIRIVGTVQDVTEQRELMDKLKKSEELYQQTEALAHLGSWSQNLRTGKLHWSDELYRILGIGVQPEPLPFDQFIAFVHPGDRRMYEEHFENAIRHQQPFQLEYRIIARNGALKNLVVHTEVQIDAEGKTCGLFGFVQDITEKKEAETRLQESQKLIEKIANTAPSMIALYNPHTGKHLFVNEGIKKLLGYEPADALQEGIGFIDRLIDPADVPDRKAFLETIQELADNNGQDTPPVYEHTYRIRHKNGQWRWFTTYTTVFDRTAEGAVELLLNISLDVTAQKEVEAELAEQQHFIRHIADASPTILYLYDVEKSSMVYVNREIFFVLGYTPEDVLEMGSQVTEQLYHPDDLNLLPERKRSRKRIVENDLMLQYECRLKTKEGDWQWFLVREVVFKTRENGSVAQIVGAALDITKRKDMERTLLQNSFKLEQSNASLEEFAYVASHDLKEPLRKISTFGDRLVATQMDKLSPEGKIYLKKIVDASQRMQTMISDLLSISLISGDKSYEPYSLQQVLEEVLQTLEFKIEQKNALIESDGLPVAQIIPSQFRQLFQNLLSNSLKFAKEDEQPRITIRHSYVNGEEAGEPGGTGNYLRIEIKDNGIGFENEFAGKIFAIFQRLHGRSEYEGSGIGLAICKKIVEHHGGLIYATGVPGEGATFTIILPE